MDVKDTWHISNGILHFSSRSTLYYYLPAIKLEDRLLWTTSMGSTALGLLVWFGQWECHQEIRKGDEIEFSVFVFLVASQLGWSLALTVFIYLRPQILSGSPLS